MLIGVLIPKTFPVPKRSNNDAPTETGRTSKNSWKVASVSPLFSARFCPISPVLAAIYAGNARIDAAISGTETKPVSSAHGSTLDNGSLLTSSQVVPSLYPKSAPSIVSANGSKNDGCAISSSVDGRQDIPSVPISMTPKGTFSSSQSPSSSADCPTKRTRPPPILDALSAIPRFTRPAKESSSRSIKSATDELGLSFSNSTGATTSG